MIDHKLFPHRAGCARSMRVPGNVLFVHKNDSLMTILHALGRLALLVRVTSRAFLHATFLRNQQSVIMKIQTFKGCIIVLAAIALASAASSRAQSTLIPLGAVWKYLDDGSDQGTAWSAADFNDTAWASGPAELGFGDGGEATTNRSGFITYYYRQTFSVPDASSVTNLRARLKRDDGAVVYLNGVEVFRDNMPTGAVTAATLAPIAATDDGQNFWPHSFSAAALVSGNNVLAVEVHQTALTSSDISFDLELVANPLPSIAI